MKLFTTLEIALVCVCLIVLCTNVGVAFNHDRVPDYMLNLYRGRNAGTNASLTAMLFGWLTLPLYILNVSTGSHRWWPIRIAAILLLFFVMAIIGNMY